MTTQRPLRIGLIGAGANTRSRHIPGLRALPSVEIVSVCNRRPESTAAIAREFKIPRTCASWEDVVRDPEVDAVVIGTWPYLHCPITLAALDAGKHVLSQARMAMNAREAQRTLDRSRESPSLTAMVGPSPYGLTGATFLRTLIAAGLLAGRRDR